MRIFFAILGAAAFAVAVLSSGSLIAQSSQAWKACLGEGAPPELQVSGCNLVIQSGKASDARLAIAYNKRCDVSVDTHAYSTTIQYCDEAIAYDPKAASHWYVRGRAYLGRGDHNRAIADFDEAIRLDPQVRFAYYDRCFVHTVTDQLQPRSHRSGLV